MVRFLKAKFAGGDDGPDAAYRAKVVSTFQKRHIAGRETVLTDVFVAPRFLAPHSALSEETLLDDGTAALHYLWPDLAASVATVPPPSVTLSELITHGRRVLVIGEAGAGKSTLLAYLAIQMAGSGMDEQAAAQAGTLPVHLHLAQLEKPLIEAGQADLWSGDPLSILQNVLDQHDLTTRGFKKVLDLAAEAGNLFLLIDGWDELSGVGLGHTGRWLDELLARYPDTRVFMSAPSRGYGPLNRLGFLVVGLIPWRRGQAMAVGRKWAAARGADRPLWVSKYWRPGQTPLVTWLRLRQLAQDEDAGSPPSGYSNTELLKQAIDQALRRQMDDADLAGTLPALWRLAQMLATKLVADRAWILKEEDITALLDTLQNEIPGNGLGRSTENALRMLAESGLFADAIDSVRFQSPVIRDYLAALHLVEHAELADVLRHVDEAHWTGVIRSYMRIIGSRGRPKDLALPVQHSRILYQAADWVTDMRRADPWRQSVLLGLGKRCLDAKSPPMARQRAAVALARTEDPGVAALMHQVMQRPEPAMRQVALAVLACVAPDEVMDAAPRMMADSDPLVRAASVHAVAWINHPARDEALLEALYARDHSVSGAAAEALALNGTEDSFRALRDAAQSRQFSARQAARAGLRLIDEPWAAELLVRSLRADGLAAPSSLTSTAIGDSSQQAAARWRRLRPGDQPWLVAWAVARGLIVPVGQAAVPILLEALHDDEAAIRARAALTLGQLAIVDGTSSLKEALRDESPNVRQAAFIALHKIARAWDLGI